MASPFSFEPDPDVSDHPSFRELLACWNAKRGSRALPLRKEVDPVELQRHLGSLNLIECLPDFSDFRYRLIGTNIVQAYGRDSTGKTVRQLYADTDAEYCDFLLRAYHDVATRTIIGRIRGTLRPVNKNFRTADSLLLPLDGGDGTVRWILNSVLFDERLSRE
jgi:hypothetical protein